MTIRSRSPQSRRLAAACLLGAAMAGATIAAVPANASTAQARDTTPGIEQLQADDFNLHLYHDAGTVVAGENIGSIIAPESQIAQPVGVALSTGDLPAGVTVDFAPPSLLTGNLSTATISTSPSTSPGSYEIAIIGTGNGQTESEPFTLTVQ